MSTRARRRPGPRTRRAHALRAGAVVERESLTPVELHDGIAYKRDDRFLPFADVDLSGGKVRQTLALVAGQLDELREQHDSTLLAATGVHSQYGLVVARVAHEYGLRCVLFLGATSIESARRHRLVRLAERCGATFDCDARVAYEPALLARVRCWQREHGPGRLLVRFGADPRDRSVVLGTNAAQARNVPEHVRVVVVPVGSGVSAAGIIAGLREHASHVERVVLVQIAGYDRRSVLDELGVDRSAYEWHVTSRYPYSRLVQRSVAPGFGLDPLYESKAHEYLVDELHPPRDGSWLFWVVADTRFVR